MNGPVPGQVPGEAVLALQLSRIGWWGTAGLLLAAVLLGFFWHWAGGLQWLLQAGLVWGFAVYQTARRLHLNRPELDAPLYGELGWGNGLTLLRAWLTATVAGFLFQPWPQALLLSWLPGLLYFAAAVIDRVDGYVARRTRHGSLLGGELDTVFDALGLAVASLLAFGYGQIHWSYLLVGAAYYLFQGGLAWRTRRGLPVYPLPPALHRRTWAGFQMGFLVVALWPVFSPPLTSLGGFAFMLPALLGFVIDWLIVSGRINRQAAGVDRVFRRLTHFSQTVLQPVLRLLIVILLLVSLWQSGLVGAGGFGFGPGWQGLAGGLLVAVSLILLGIAGRAASLMMIGMLVWYFGGQPQWPVDYVLLCCVIWLLLLGTGRFSLWLEDDHWLNRYDGA